MSGWKSMEMGKLSNLQSKTRCRICIFENMRICISLLFYFTSNWMFFKNFALLIEQNRHPVFGIFHYFLPASLLSQTLLPTFLIQIKLACVQKTKTLHLRGSRRENLKTKKNETKLWKAIYFITLALYLLRLCSLSECLKAESQHVLLPRENKTQPTLACRCTPAFSLTELLQRVRGKKMTLSEAALEAGGQLTLPHLPFQPRGHGWTPRGCVLCGLSERSR